MSVRAGNAGLQVYVRAMAGNAKTPAALPSGGGFDCALDRIRTYDLLLRRQTLYPLSYEGNSGFLPLPAGRPRA